MANVTFKRDGSLLLIGVKVGNWKKRDLWKENHNSSIRYGYKIVHYLWEANLITGEELKYNYTRKELAEAVAKRWKELFDASRKQTKA